MIASGAVPALLPAHIGWRRLANSLSSRDFADALPHLLIDGYGYGPPANVVGEP